MKYLMIILILLMIIKTVKTLRDLLWVLSWRKLQVK
jgi:hypothetical protein